MVFTHWLTGITRCGNKELVKYKMSFLSESSKEIDVCGVVLPNIPLSNIILQKPATRLNINNFRGVFLRDELPERPRANEISSHICRRRGGQLVPSCGANQGRN